MRGAASGTAVRGVQAVAAAPVAAVVVAAAVLATGCEERACERRPGHACALAGTGEYSFNGDGLAPTATDLFLVTAARRGPDDLIYIMDFNNQRLRRIGADGLVE